MGIVVDMAPDMREVITKHYMHELSSMPKTKGPFQCVNLRKKNMPHSKVQQPIAD